MNEALEAWKKKIHGRKIAVIGVGVSNTPLISLLKEWGGVVTAHDKKEELGEVGEKLRAAGVGLCCGGGYLDDLTGYDLIFKTPGLRFDHPGLLQAAAAGAEITSEMEVFFEVCPARIFAVTGSDGKTTTTTLIEKMLGEAGYCCHLGGNIGKPLLPEIERIREHDMVVVELSSFQLHTMKKSPYTAVVTNLAPNHLDMHKDMEEYVEAKKNIFLYQKEGDRLILNADNAITAGFGPEAKGELLWFSRLSEPENGVFLRGGEIVDRINGHERILMEKEDIALPGDHNVENYMAACAAVLPFVDPLMMKAVARRFKGVPHRLEFVRELHGVKYYNDSIASSPTRTLAGLKSFSQKLIVIAGGYDKKIPFDLLGEGFVEHAKAVVLTGATADKIEGATKNAPGYREGTPAIVRADGFDEAVFKAKELAEPGDIVILSPACASFDRFENFEERGNTFKRIVEEL